MVHAASPKTETATSSFLENLTEHEQSTSITKHAKQALRREETASEEGLPSEQL